VRARESVDERELGDEGGLGGEAVVHLRRAGGYGEREREQPRVGGEANAQGELRLCARGAGDREEPEQDLVEVLWIDARGR
jgi:hypothetical protein